VPAVTKYLGTNTELYVGDVHDISASLITASFVIINTNNDQAWLHSIVLMVK